MRLSLLLARRFVLRRYPNGLVPHDNWMTCACFVLGSGLFDRKERGKLSRRRSDYRNGHSRRIMRSPFFITSSLSNGCRLESAPPKNYSMRF